MAELLSVGLDVGTTSTQMVVSRLTIENRAGAFSVPEMDIAGREILYQSPVHFTPLLGIDRVDGAALREIVEEEYVNAGIRREDVDTGAVIITGETSRRENARAVVEALSDFAGDFVVATAGPDLESVLAAKGAGAVTFSEKTGKTVLHFDIGGGTSNLALIEDGVITATACLNVGGRLVKIENGKIGYISPVLDGFFHKKVGDTADERELAALAENLAQVLEMAAGLREIDGRLNRLETQEIATPVCALARNDMKKVISFSGGVADCIDTERDWRAFGDIGVLLGRAIRRSRLCRGEYMLGEQTIRATVIGAGCHSAQLSGSTVFYKNVAFPMKNLPVAAVTEEEQTDASRIRDALSRQEGERVALALPGIVAPGYDQVKTMAANLAMGFGSRPVIVALEQDMAKALGHALALILPPDREVLCIDNVRLESHSYLDVGAPVGPALPIVVKTLILSR